MAKVVQFPKSKQEQEVIDRLKNLLSEAEEGNLYQVAFVGFSNNGTIIECVSLDDNMYELIGSLNVMIQRLTKKITECEHEIFH